MLSKKNIWIGLAIILIGMLLSGCGPSPEEQTATAVALTAAAATSTPTITPTFSPTPTSTPTPTPTPIPEPDPKAMIHWDELNLPPGFLSISPAAIGIGEGDFAFRRQLEDGTVVTYRIEGSFVFADEWPEGIYGYTALFPSDSDKEFFDVGMLNLVDVIEEIVIYAFHTGNLSKPKDIPEASGIGDLSAGAETTYSKRGKTYLFYIVRFRVGDIGVNVFLRHEASEDPIIQISDLARIYAHSILNPVERCKLTSASPVENETWPTYDIRAEGFYPEETRAIMLIGDVLIDGETKSVVSALMGLEGQSADNQGRIEERVAFQVVEGENVIPPSEVEIKIRGYHSGCLIVDELPWHTTTQRSTPDPLSTPERIPTANEPYNTPMPDANFEVFQFITFNLNDPIVGELAVRRAIAHASDRQSLGDAWMRPYIPVILNSYIHPDSPYYAGDDNLTIYTFDPDRSRSILEEVGWLDSDGDGVRERGGVPLRLDYYTTGDIPERIKLAESFAAQMGSIGIEIIVHPTEREEIFGDGDTAGIISKGNFQLAQFAYRMDPYGEFWPTEPLEEGCNDSFLHSKCIPTSSTDWAGSNVSWWRNDEADSLIDRIITASSSEDRYNLLLRLQQLFTADLPFLPLFYTE